MATIQSTPSTRDELRTRPPLTQAGVDTVLSTVQSSREAASKTAAALRKDPRAFLSSAFALSDPQLATLARVDDGWLRTSVTDAVARALQDGVEVVAVITQQSEALKLSCSAGANLSLPGPNNNPPARLTVQVTVTIS